jgi:DNA-binding transcriptional LysR family regulator
VRTLYSINRINIIDYMNKIERSISDGELLRSFLVIAESGNLTRAAERLHRTQSAISVQLRKLEDGLGASLFKRHVRGMRLTAQGETLLPVARQAVAELERVAQLFREPLRGRIRVGIPDDFDETVLEHVLAAFAARNPGVEVIAISGCTSGYLEAVHRGELDIAVHSGPDLPSGAVLSTEPTVWACSQDYLIAPDEPVQLAILDRDCWWRDLPTAALAKAGREWRVAYQSASFPGLRAAVRAGLAVAPLPQRSIEPGMRVMAAKEGMPDLPKSFRSMVISEQAPKGLAEAMADSIRSSISA